MVLYLILLLVICLYGMKFSSFHRDYMSVQATTAIKGVFAILILLSHLQQYISLGYGIPDRAFGFTMRYLDQLIVAAYFFYSGFGIAESARLKAGYTRGFFKKRFLKTLLHFDLAVLLFLIVQTVTGNHFGARQYLLCWIGWENLGNSSWFIFAILFILALTAVTTFAQWDNKVLQWLGKHCFSIYMLQRLPMIIFGKTTLVHHSVVFTALTLACALLLAWAFTAMTDRIDKRVFA